VGPSRHQFSVVFRERVRVAFSVERGKVAESLTHTAVFMTVRRSSELAVAAAALMDGTR
jgi:hypothetical protein